MNILLSTIGRRSYIADYFRSAIRKSGGNIIGTTDRHDLESEFTVGLLACDKSFVVPSVKSPDYIDALLEICRQEKIRFSYQTGKPGDGVNQIVSREMHEGERGCGNRRWKVQSGWL